MASLERTVIPQEARRPEAGLFTIKTDPRREVAVQKSNGKQPLVWAVTLIGLFLAAALVAFTVAIWREDQAQKNDSAHKTQQIQAQLREQTDAIRKDLAIRTTAANEAFGISSRAEKTANDAKDSAFKTEQSLGTFRQSQAKILGELKELNRRLTDVERRLSAGGAGGGSTSPKPATGQAVAQSGALLPGSGQPPSAQAGPAQPAAKAGVPAERSGESIFAKQLDSMFPGKRIYHAQPFEDTWTLNCTDGNTNTSRKIEAQPYGSSNDGVYVRDVLTGQICFADTKTGKVLKVVVP